MDDTFQKIYMGRAGTGAPKYIQLSEAIVSAIKDGYWKAGSKLPAELEIARTIGFSLGTVQKSLRTVADRGIIERRHGHGTFVSQGMPSPWHCRFVDGKTRSFFPIYPKVLDRKLVTKDEPWAKLLTQGEGGLLQIDRVVQVGQGLSVYHIFYVAQDRYPVFWEKPLNELNEVNFKILLQREYGVSIHRASNFVRLVSLPPGVRHGLSLRRGTHGLLLETLANSAPGKSVYFSEVYVPPTRSRLFVSDFPNLPEFLP
jgi:GntR family transcriptional regulator